MKLDKQELCAQLTDRFFEVEVVSERIVPLEQVVTTLRASFYTTALEPRVTKETTEVARIPAGRWSALLAAFGLPHKTKPVMAVTRWTVEQNLPVLYDFRTRTTSLFPRIEDSFRLSKD